MSGFTISDMIDSANRVSPSDFQSSFKDVILDKIASAIEQKRVELAQGYFSSQDAEETSEEDADIQNNEDNEDEDTETDSGNEEEREA
jgi:hypothetical protein